MAQDQKITLVLSGTEVALHTIREDFTSESIELKNYIQLDSYRSPGNEVTLECSEDDIICLGLEEGGEWIGSALDIPEVYRLSQLPKTYRSGTTDKIYLPSFIESPNQTRGGTNTVIKWIKRFFVKKATSPLSIKAAEALAQWVDRKILEREGLYSVGSSIKELNKVSAPDTLPVDRTYLLLLHGTLSSTLGSFGQLGISAPGKDLWKKVSEQYTKRILAFEHATISKSPLDNVIEILKTLPTGIHLDILSHSRGGLIADILSRCNADNETVGFSKEEQETYKSNLMDWHEKITDEFDVGEESEKLTLISTLAKAKKITVNKVIRVAAPSRGTTLLSSRIDHYLNGLLWCVGKALGGESSPLFYIYDAVKNFTMKVIKQRNNADIFPGLASMIPESPFQLLINDPTVKVKGELLALEGNAELGNFTQSIAVILTNLFYLKANDFVVDTENMRYGVRRESRMFFKTVKDGTTNHFSYFKHSKATKLMGTAMEWDMDGLPTDWEYASETGETRGVGLRQLKFEEYTHDSAPTYEKPLVILLPGNMGSHLYDGTEKVWASLQSLLKGRLAGSAEKEDLTAPSIFDAFYGDLARTLLRSGFDLDIVPYDWRLGTGKAEKILRGVIEKHLEHTKDIRILAHSLGGLVIRQLMIEDEKRSPNEQLWRRLNDLPRFRCIMMGTPWRGSYAAIKALFGKGMIANIIKHSDRKHPKKTTVEAFQKFYGIYQMLPLSEPNVASWDYWQEKIEAANLSRLYMPNAGKLARFKSEDFDTFEKFKIKAEYVQKIHYVRGKDETDEAPYLDQSIFGKKLKFKTTDHGDGVVTWELGIPKELPHSQVWSSASGHNMLMADQENFSGILRLLNGMNFRGSASDQKVQFKTEEDSKLPEYGIIDHRGPLEDVFNINDKTTNKNSAHSGPLKVEITHGDLRYAQTPVMVGHFKYDGIVSAERALDQALNNALSHRHRLREYPNEVGENLVTYKRNEKFRGGIVIGMGSMESLTESQLATSVKSGILNYALHIKDNFPEDIDRSQFNEITSICIASDFGGLSLKSSLRAIINGVIRANESLIKIDSSNYIIKKLEFINYYEDIARRALYLLHSLQTEIRNNAIEVGQSIVPGKGGKKRIPDQREEDWWPSLTTKTIQSQGKDGHAQEMLEFMASGHLARVDQARATSTLNNIYTYIKSLGEIVAYSPQSSKTLFETLIPPSLKSIIRAENNIHWKVDQRSAAIPWEMIHDSIINDEPTFINSGLIRQLINPNIAPKVDVCMDNTALIIADPIYNSKEFRQLKGARLEGEEVEKLLSAEKEYITTSLYREKIVPIYDQLFSGKYAILHIAGHGVFNYKGNTGIVVENSYITPGDLGHIPVIPQFVFINCCYSGASLLEGEEDKKNRSELAANIGQQLIQMGVHAAIVTGWPVDDDAALEFSQSFYREMLKGEYFGNAVRKARYDCFYKNKGVSTWAAYQAYGNPYYTFKGEGKTKSERHDKYATLDEVLIALENIYVNSDTLDRSHIENNITELQKVVEKANNSKFKNDAKILELEAKTYYKLGKFDLALNRYKTLIKSNNATYSTKSLEQYFNLESKLCSRHFDPSDTKSQNRKDNLINYSGHCLKFLGETAEKCCLLGGMYKRFSLLEEENRAVYLEEMYRFYDLALQKYGDQDIITLFYPLSNMYMAHCLYEHIPKKNVKVAIRGRKITFRDKKLSWGEVLEKVQQEFDDLPKVKYMGFYQELIPATMGLMQLLHPGKMKYQEAREIKTRIVNIQRRTLEEHGCPRVLDSEINHYDFILKTLETNQDGRHKFFKIIQEIQDVLKSME